MSRKCWMSILSQLWCKWHTLIWEKNSRKAQCAISDTRHRRWIITLKILTEWLIVFEIVCLKSWRISVKENDFSGPCIPVHLVFNGKHKGWNAKTLCKSFNRTKILLRNYFSYEITSYHSKFQDANFCKT